MRQAPGLRPQVQSGLPKALVLQRALALLLVSVSQFLPGQVPRTASGRQLLLAQAFQRQSAPQPGLQQSPVSVRVPEQARPRRRALVRQLALHQALQRVLVLRLVSAPLRVSINSFSPVSQALLA